MAAVVERHDLHAHRQAGRQRSQARFDRFDQVRSIGTTQRDHDALDGFALAIAGHRTVAGQRLHAHLGDIADAYWYITATNHDAAQVLQRLDGALGAHDQGLFTGLQPAGAVIAVVAFDRIDQIALVQAVGNQQAAVGNDHEALCLPTQYVDIGHAGQGAQGRAQGPVEQAAALLQAQSAALDGEHVDIGQRRGDRCQSSTHPGGKIGGDPGEAFGHLLPRPEDLGAFGKIQSDVGNGVLGHRAQHRALGHAQQFHFQRSDDPCFHFFRGHARCFQDQLDLGGRNVWISVDGQVQESKHSCTCQRQCAEHDQHALSQREFNEPCEHDPTPPAPLT